MQRARKRLVSKVNEQNYHDSHQLECHHVCELIANQTHKRQSYVSSYSVIQFVYELPSLLYDLYHHVLVVSTIQKENLF